MLQDNSSEHFCPRCHGHWAVHNDDGSCVDDAFWENLDEDEKNWEKRVSKRIVKVLKICALVAIILYLMWIYG